MVLFSSFGFLHNVIGIVFLMAEQTFIVLDRELIVGNFIHGETHVEGCVLVLIFGYFNLVTPCSFISMLISPWFYL